MNKNQEVQVAFRLDKDVFKRFKHIAIERDESIKKILERYVMELLGAYEEEKLK